MTEHGSSFAEQETTGVGPPQGPAPQAWRTTVAAFRDKWLNREKSAPLLYMGSSVAMSLAQMVAGIVVVRYVVPFELGLWNSINLALTYSWFVLAGAQNGLSRELPFFLGAKDDEHAERLTGTALYCTACATLLFLVSGLACLGVLAVTHADPRLLLAVGGTTLLIAFNFYKNYLTVTFRSKNSFWDLSRVQFAQTALMLFTLPLIAVFQYQGMVYRTVLVTGLALGLMHYVRPMRVAPVWDKASVVSLLKTGIPIFLLDYLRLSAMTFDRVALLYFGGVLDVGYYALALSVCTAFEVIPLSVGNYVYPRMTYRYGQSNDPRSVWDLARKATVVTLAAMVPLAVVGWFLLPPVVQILFPKYAEGTFAAQLMLLTALGTGGVVGVNALWSMKAWKWMVTYQTCLGVLMMVGPFVGVMLASSPLTGAALGIMVGRLLMVPIGIAITYVATHTHPSTQSTA